MFSTFAIRRSSFVTWSRGVSSTSDAVSLCKSSPLERPRHGLVAADVRYDTQLKLGVVGDHKTMVACRNETPPHRPVSRNLLQVRVAACESPVYRADLKKGRVYPSRQRVDVPGKGIQKAIFEL